MSNPLQIGVTGGIGSGKSLVCEIFMRLGVPVYNSDDKARWLMNNNAELKAEIIKAFGDKSYKPDGKLNRDHVASRVFNNEVELAILNRLVHPAVAKDYQKWMSSFGSKDYVIKEAALMFKSGSYKVLDKIITVSAPEELRAKRVKKRDPFRSNEEIKSIMKRQLKDSERIDRSDYVIYNDETQMLISQVLTLHNMFSGTRTN